MRESIGEKLSPILEEIEGTLFEFEAEELGQPLYTEAGFRAAVKIFMSAFMDKVWDKQQLASMPVAARLEMAEDAGHDIRRLIEIYTDIDTHELYK